MTGRRATSHRGTAETFIADGLCGPFRPSWLPSLGLTQQTAGACVIGAIGVNGRRVLPTAAYELNRGTDPVLTDVAPSAWIEHAMAFDRDRTESCCSAV